MKWLISIDIIYTLIRIFNGINFLWMDFGMIFLNIAACVMGAHGSKWKVKYVGIMPMIFTFACIIFMWVSVSEFETVVTHFAENIYQLEERIKYGKETRMDAMTAKHLPAKEVRLRVELEHPAEIYWKCFCGTVYKENGWNAAYPWEETFFGIENHLKMRGFDADTQLIEYVSKEKLLNDKECCMVKIENLSASRKYDNEIYYLQKEKICFASAAKEFSEKLLRCKTKNSSEEEMIYRSMVYQTCLHLPDDFRERCNA